MEVLLVGPLRPNGKIDYYYWIIEIKRKRGNRFCCCTWEERKTRVAKRRGRISHGEWSWENFRTMFGSYSEREFDRKIIERP